MECVLAKISNGSRKLLVFILCKKFQQILISGNGLNIIKLGFLFIVSGDKKVLVLATASVDKKVKLWAAPSLNAS